jgi:murein DD-endopeptidase MepM/ murein hydrolase activator NlpD
MRKFTPIIVILAALSLYAGRDTVLRPFMRPIPAQSTHPAVTETTPLETSTPDAGTQTASIEPTLLPENDGNAARVPALFPSASSAPPAEPTEGRIGKNSSMYVELRRVGVTPQEIDKIVRASKKTYNLRRVRAGQKFDVFTAGGGLVDSLFFYFDSERFLGVRRVNPEGFVASIDTVPYVVTYHVTEGVIRQSVFVTLQEQRAETELAAQLAEIFGWTIDFFTDIRRGDSFAVLYERKTYENGRRKLGEVLAACVSARENDYYAFRYQGQTGRTGYYDENGKSMEKSLRRAPVKYTRVTSNFSHRRYHPINKRYLPHYGCDFGAPYGTPVHATGDGTVLVATRRTGNGNYVKIKHNNTYTTYYLHLQRFAKGVRKGKWVKQGQVIGYVGSTGWANGPHVCYRIKKNGSWVNPRTVKLPSKEPIRAAGLERFRRLRDAYLIRLNESILDGVDNRTILVERPSYPTGTQVLAPF